MLSDPDVILMLEFKKGDKASFEKLMVRYFPRLLNFIYRFVQSREIAEDLTQEVFMKVYHSATHYHPDPKAKFNTWLYTIARNMALNEIRKNKRIVMSLDARIASKEGMMDRQMEDKKAIRPDEDMLRKEKAEMVREAIDSLPKNQRMAVMLRRYEQLSYEEIAKIMHVSSKAVKSLLSRAKEHLKNKLEKLR